ncbi:hypothetical protein [Galbibacter pacificus]|uniref:Peptidase S74 domain-containing protein n=1 Tax=Galbibacter pacificus TaxID=2996052 RepID=A0ABT6FNR3_9FLAO|nr:hypothetical protein [Galbibacter pacificus]MDG3581258.1 hypothetical protein [Galbibacter pacificus]MDG3584736.1 hypothetical protein [Galbibacter pacificus]
MTKDFINTVMVLLPLLAFSQSNIFPGSGNVGVGVDNPIGKLEIIKNSDLSSSLSMPNSSLLLRSGLEDYSATLRFGVDGNNMKAVIQTQQTTSAAKYDLLINPYGGNVGIGTKSPLGKLHLKGDLYLDGTESVNGWARTRVHWKGHSLIFGTLPGRYAHNLIELKPGGSTSGELYSSMEFYQAIGENNHEKRIRIISHSGYPTFFNAGNVGIGTEDPGSWKLAVNGKIRAKEVKVETSWSDFVFENDYELPTLEEVEKHIQEKGHLKDIPSDKEVAKEGIYLGEMDAKLLQKIEELTLYIIEQNKRIEALEDKLDNCNHHDK